MYGKSSDIEEEDSVESKDVSVEDTKEESAEDKKLVVAHLETT